MIIQKQFCTESVKIVKKRFNKIFLLIAVISMIIFPSCTAQQSENDKLNIVTTLFPQYDFSRQITGDNANVELLLMPGSESHAYEPTPKDISKIQKADVFIYIGGESEVWADELLDSVQNKELKVVRLMDYVTPIEEEHDEHSHDEIEYDEHIFTSIRNSEILLNEICNAICEADNENEDIYRKNADNYSQKLSELDGKFTDMINSAKRKTVVFGDRFPLVYFAEDYGLEWHAAFSGCSSETEASPATISSLIDIVKKESIPAVFYIEFSTRTIADKIANASGVKTLLFHSCHNISKEDFENGVSYVDLMNQNYTNLSEALN